MACIGVEFTKKVLFDAEEERFISKIANNAKEAVELVKLGFEYVTGEYDDGGKIFRKRDLSI